MKTLIRASQLHPDVSGLVAGYTSPLYPNYNNIYATSGLSAIQSGDSLVLTVQGGNEGVLNNVNGITGSINITGFSGIGTYFQNSTLYIFPSGGGSVGTLNSLSGNVSLTGRGTVTVWPISSDLIAISGYTIVGEQGVQTYISGNNLRIRADAVYRINSTSGDINLVGRNGVSIIPTGQSIIIDAGQAAFSGVNAINGIQNGPLFLLPGKDLGIFNATGQKTIILDYIGSGWGSNNILTNVTDNRTSFIGNANNIQADQDIFVHGSSNFTTGNKSSSLLRSSNNQLQACENACIVNSTGSSFFQIKGSTLINANNFHGSTYNHPYGFAVGTSSDNTFYNSIHMKALISGGFGVSGFNPIKKMRVPKSNYDGIFVQTGSVLMGHIDYVAARYNIQDFYASYDVASDGIYGRKHFVVQRGTNLKIDIKDQADLFGGNDKYSIFLSGANDTKLYILASGFSGHDAVFMANLYYTQFNLTLTDD